MVNLMGYSVLVDNEEQAEQLQKMAFEQGFEWCYGSKEIQYLDQKSFQFGYCGEKLITFNYGGSHYQDKYITKKAHFNCLFNSLEHQLEKAKAEVKRLEKEIENRKIKVGDWGKFWDIKGDFVIGKFERNIFGIYMVSGKTFLNCEKITNPQLIELLEKEMK